MIVLSILIIIVVILIISVIIIKFSTVKLKLINFKIKNYMDLKQILILIKKKEYVKIFDCLDFILKFQISFFNKVVIFSAKVSDEQIEKFLKKQVRKNKLKKEDEKTENLKKENKNKIKKELQKVNLEMLDLLLELGTKNASITALEVTLLNSIISIFLPFILYKGEVNDKIDIKKYKYEINPIYMDKLVFYINVSLVLSIPIMDLIKLLKQI